MVQFSNKRSDETDLSKRFNRRLFQKALVSCQRYSVSWPLSLPVDGIWHSHHSMRIRRLSDAETKRRNSSRSTYFPTCQVRVVRFYVSALLLLSSPLLASPLLVVTNRDPVRSVFRTGPQPRSCEVSVPHRTSTAIL